LATSGTVRSARSGSAAADMTMAMRSRSRVAGRSVSRIGSAPHATGGAPVSPVQSRWATCSKVVVRASSRTLRPR
jgi:hypothetical protein